VTLLMTIKSLYLENHIGVGRNSGRNVGENIGNEIYHRILKCVLLVI